MPPQMPKGRILNAQKGDLIYHPFQRENIDPGFLVIIEVSVDLLLRPPTSPNSPYLQGNSK